jgi:hypothetical protein
MNTDRNPGMKGKKVRASVLAAGLTRILKQIPRPSPGTGLGSG